MSLQRCSSQPETKVEEYNLGEPNPYGLRIYAEPELPNEQVFVGMKARFTFWGDELGKAKVTRPGSRTFPAVTSWASHGPDDSFKKYPSGPIATIAIDQAGLWLVLAEIRINPRTKVRVATSVRAVSREEFGERQLGKLKPRDYLRFRGHLEVHHLEIAGGGIKDQRFGTPYITSSGANPAVPLPAPDHEVFTYRIHPTREARLFRWYVQVQDPTYMARDYYGWKRQTIDGEEVWALNSEPVATKTFRWIIGYFSNIDTIVCREYDAKGKPLGSVARYVQANMSEKDAKAVHSWRKYMHGAEENIAKIIEHKEVAVQAVHVDELGGSVTPLALFVGPDADGTGLRIVDLTPGVPRVHYEGSSAADALAEFDGRNKYAQGFVALKIPPNQQGIPSLSRRYDTNGESTAGAAASGFGWASLGLTALGVAALFVPGGQVVAGALLISAAGTGVVSGGLSIYDRLQDAEPSGAGIALDVLGIVASVFGGAASFKALRHGSGVLIASRGGRFLLWGGFASEAAAAVLITVEGVAEINRILDSDLSRSAKVDAIVRIVRGLVLNGGLLALSVKDFGKTRQKLSRLLGETRVEAIPKDAMHTMGLLDDQAVETLALMSDDEMLKAINTIRKDPEAVGRLLATKPYSSAADLEGALTRSKGLVTDPVPGLFDAIPTHPKDAPAGWRFVDRPIQQRGSVKSLKTEVFYKDASGKDLKGYFIREYDTATGQVVMSHAFLQDLPNRISHPGPSLRDGTTPTVTYVTIRQMKKLGALAGKVKKIKMSKIQNVETIAHLEWLRRKYPGKTYDELIEMTHSVRYTMTPVTQAGYTAVPGSFRVSPGGEDTVARLSTIFPEHAAEFASYGLSPNDKVRWNFNITWDVAPAQKP